MIPDSDVTPRARKAAWIPESYAADTVASAAAIIKHWNSVLHAAGGPRCNGGDAGNTRAIKRFFDQCQRSGPPFSAIDVNAVCQAINAYAVDSGNVRLGRWKRMREWLDPENVQAQLDRATGMVDAAAGVDSGADREAARLRKQQQEIFDRFSDLCPLATAEGKPLRHYLRDAWERADHLSALPHLSKLDAAFARAKTGIAMSRLTLMRRYDSLPPDLQSQVMDQARAIFQAVQGRPPRDCEAARDLLLAICMALVEPRT